MCGRVIQSSGPLRLAIVEGLNVSDSRLANVPRRYNAAPSQELFVIRQNHKTLRRNRTTPSHPTRQRREVGLREAELCLSCRLASSSGVRGTDQCSKNSAITSQPV